jgi:hypothetical protein
MYLERTRKRIEALKIPADEQKAIDAAIEEKFAARQQLERASLLLYQVAVELESTEDELKRALNDFLTARDRFQRRIREIDDALVQRVSTRTRAKITTTGHLDNGLGFLGPNPLVASKLPAIGGPGPHAQRHGTQGFGPRTETRASGVDVGAGAGAVSRAP